MIIIKINLNISLNSYFKNLEIVNFSICYYLNFKINHIMTIKYIVEVVVVIITRMIKIKSFFKMKSGNWNRDFNSTDYYYCLNCY